MKKYIKPEIEYKFGLNQFTLNDSNFIPDDREEGDNDGSFGGGWF